MAVGVRISITEAVVAEGVDVWAEGEGVDVWAVGVMGVAEEKGSKDCPMDGNGDKTVFEEGLDVVWGGVWEEYGEKSDSA